MESTNERHRAMSNDDTPEMKLVFAPGCFDSFEGTQDELEELIAHIKNLFETGELLEQSVEVDAIELREDYPEVLEALEALHDEVPNNRKLH